MTDNNSNYFNENLYNSSDLPPVTNRVVLCTTESGVSLLFDWVQATFHVDLKNTDVYSIFYKLFGITRYDVLLNAKSPLFGYDRCYSYNNIQLFTSNREDMGIHLYLTGSGCRDFESLGLSYKDLFTKLLTLNCKFTRIDVSYDDFTGKYFNLNKINNCIKNNEVVCKFRSSIQFTKNDLNSTDNIGHTIWFGSRASDIQYVFYDKLKERKCNNVEVIDDVKYWNRFEMRYRNDYAYEIAVNFTFLSTSDFVNYLKSVINNYISFRCTNIHDSNRRRWKYKKWWSDFIDVTDRVFLQNKPIEYSITRKSNWLFNSCSYSNFAVLIATIQDLTSDSLLSHYLFKFFQKGSEKLSDYELQQINQYRIKNNLVPLTYAEVVDFVKSIKEVVLKK